MPFAPTSVPSDTVTVLAGRDDELARIGDFLGAARTEPRALLLEGEPGIGKTALWRAAVEEARTRGFRLLTARPAEAEASLSFSALGDLLADASDAIGALPEPQRHALRVALLLEESEGSTDPRTLSVAVLGLLRVLAEDGLLLIAVDDVQWLDPPTAGALSFALRRLESEAVAFLGAARPRTLTLTLERLDTLTLGPLDLSALDRMVRAQHGTSLARPVLRRLEQVSGGNPFYARELAGALLRRQDPHAVGALALPEKLTDLVRERLAALSVPAQSALLAVAALSAPTPEVVAAAVQDADALRAAVDAKVVVVEGERVRLEHPLLGSVAYADAPAERRRALHGHLAQLVTGPEDRARHLANAAERPDEAVAQELELAARGARARGAAETAAELAELAVELTPADAPEPALKRRSLAGDCYFAAGDAHRANELFEEVAASMAPGPPRARILWRHAAVKAAVEGPPAAFPLYGRALDEAGDDVRLKAQIYDRLATWSWISEGAAAAEPHTRALVALAEKVGEPALLARAIGAQLAIDLAQGRELDQARYTQMLALEREGPEQGVELPGSTLHLQMLSWAGAYEESRARIAHFLERARQRSEASQILPLWCAGYVDLMTANWDDTLAATARGLELVEQVGRDALVPGYMSLRALALAYLGDVERSSEDAKRAIELAELSGQEIHALDSRVALAQLDLARGNSGAAAARYAAIAEVMERRGDVGVGAWWIPDEIEAHIAEGDLLEAERRLKKYEAVARRSGQPRPQAAVARTRGLLAFAQGDDEASRELFRAALELHERFDDSYQLGRTLRALGSVQRRQRRRVEAKKSLTSALEHFEAVGARLWADRTRQELARLGGRPARTAQLTGTEEQIAALVAAGKTNAEVALSLRLSPKTVEWNLSKIYRKLHVTSRTQLAAKLATRAPITG